MIKIITPQYKIGEKILINDKLCIITDYDSEKGIITFKECEDEL